MSDDFSYDIFLSHSSKDKALVRQIAERLRADGIRVWFDEWEISPGDSIPAKIEAGLEYSRILVLCMSAHAFGSDWAQLENYTFRFRDPMNKERRFIPLRLDETPIKGSLAQFLYISWLSDSREQEYAKLLEACRPTVKDVPPDVSSPEARPTDSAIQLEPTVSFICYAFSWDRRFALSGGKDRTVRLWEVQTGRCLRLFHGHSDEVWSLAWSRNQLYALSAGNDRTIRLWDTTTGRCLRVFKGHSGQITSVSFSTDQRHILSGSNDHTARQWNIEDGTCTRITEHSELGVCQAWSVRGNQALAVRNRDVSLWNLSGGNCLQVFEGHKDTVWCVAWGGNFQQALSGSADKTLRLWDVKTGRCLRVFEGHTGTVYSVAWSADQRHALTGSSDKTIRMWDVETGECIHVLHGHTNTVGSVLWSKDRDYAISGDSGGGVHIWDLSKFSQSPEPIKTTPSPSTYSPQQVQYTNAKVLLVGESGVGKTGLSKVLAGERWQPSDSTVGAWATQWKLPVSPSDGVEREIWLWDFGGQADQRLIHQLYMDETALTILVFDGQKEDLIETLSQWDHDLTRSSRQPFSKLLVAGRIDVGGLRVSRTQIETFRKKRGYLSLLETSAKTNLGCEELKRAILNGIRWENIPWRSSPLLFKRLKEQIIRLKDEGRVLMRFNELRESLKLQLSYEVTHFTDDELKAVVSLLAGPGVLWELKFGSWILLQPERINAYAQAVIQTLRADAQERGCLPEEQVLNGALTYHSSMTRLEPDEERFVLLAMHQTLVERGLCLREQTDEGTVLIFPSYYRRERTDLVGDRAVLVSYRFSGFLDDIYATLVVRLHHTKPFRQDQLWRYAADFRTLTGKRLGIKLTRRAEGSGELEVYFDTTIPMEEKIIFSKYVQEHLLQNAQNVVRLRHYICPHCDTPSGNREVAMKKLAEGKKNILCVNCEKRIPLMDTLEELFASPSTKQQVTTLQEESAIVLDNESKERALVGEVISTVALAGQISREFNVSDHGIDMEVEFKLDSGEASGKKVYLQLKSGDSYLKRRKSDGSEIFAVKNERHIQYWMAQSFPVLLVIRNSNGEIAWMEVRDRLKSLTDKEKAPVRQLVFDGERFDVMSVRRWRDIALQQGQT